MIGLLIFFRLLFWLGSMHCHCRPLQLVMQFLYSGGCNSFDVVAPDLMELMAAASFFQLEDLLRYTEARCSQMIDIDNVVAMYIHAKVV